MNEIEKNNCENNIETVTMIPNDADWPALLREIPHPPARLFRRGTWPPRFSNGTVVNKETKFLCVVGARKHSSYGREVCETLIAGLAGYNICIVSGLALGLDAIAHEAALAARIPTIAFPGSGLNPDVLYPPRNFRIAKLIIDAGGTLLSEFENNMEATPWCFEQRNRLMAGISHATLVIEAQRPSGTLITSKYAGEYNRDTFAVPGEIFSPLSAGPHKLIKDGAAIIRNSNDILHQLRIKTLDEETSNKNKTTGQKELFEKIRGETDEEKLLYKIILDAGGKIQKDKLIHERMKIRQSNVSEILVTISLLEMNGLIAERNELICINF